MESVSSALATATRVAARCGNNQGDGEPAIVVVGSDGSIRAGTAAVESWRDRFDRIAPGRFTVIVQAVVAGARASGTLQARVRDADGGWILMQASRLLCDGDSDETVVTIKRPSGGELLGVLFAAYGLTAREREVCHEVIAGRSTSGIAVRLSISAHTVQDHLKSVFGKVGVAGRGELVARIRP